MQQEMQRAPSPSLIALGRTFASADEAVKAVRQFARSVQQRRVRTQQVSNGAGSSGSEGSKVPSSNSRSSNNKGRRLSIQRRSFSTAGSDATLDTPAPSPPVRNQAHVPTPSTTSSIQLGCENGPSGCKWVVGLERVDGSDASSSPPHWRVSFLDLNHDLQCCRVSAVAGSVGTSNSSRNSMDNDAELQLHQLFAPAPASDTAANSSSSHGAELQVPVSSTSEAFFQHQQVGGVIGAPHRYFPRCSSGAAAAVGPDGSTHLDSFELEKYAINHVTNSFAPLPVELPSMIFDIAGFATPHHTHHQLWDESGLQFQQQQYQQQYHHQHQQQQQQQQHLSSGHSTPLGAEPSREYAIHGHVAASSSHRDTTEPVAISPVASQSRPAAPSASSPGSTPSLLAEKQSVTLNTKMRWISAKEASKAVNDYALFVQKKRARMDKKTSGGRNKKYICSCTDCGWFVRLIKVTKSDNWKISSMQLAHSDNCTGEAQPSARQLAELNTMRNRVITASSGSGKLEITHDDAEHRGGGTGRGGGLGGREGERLLVQTDFTAEGESLGVKIPVRLAYRAKKILQENSTNSSFSIKAIVKGVMGLPGHDLQEKIAESYKLLPSLLQKFSDLNPGSAVCLKKDEKGRFKSAFVLPVALSDLVPSLQSVFGLEIVPCGNSSASSAATPPRYNGYFIVFLGKDGNLEHRVVAFGLIPTPDTENVAWFLRSLHNAGFQMGENVPVFLAYHQLGALAALRREFPRVLPMFCVESFIRAIEQQLLGVSQANLDFVKHQIRLASLAATVEAFHAQLSVVAQHFPSVTNFLLSFDASLWTLYASRSVKKYQWISTGFREYLSAEVEIIIKTKRPIERGASRPLHSQQQQLQQQQLQQSDESGGYDVQRIKSIQLADFDTMVPLEIIYQFLLHYLHVETRRAVELASALVSPQVRATTTMTMNAQSQSLVRLTPGAERLFHQELFESQHVKVCASEDPAIALVLSKYTTKGVGHRVHMDDGSCSCATMYQMGIPCRHLIAAARAFKGEKVILTDCDKVYTMAVHQLGLQRQSSLEDRMPALGGLNRDSSIYPAPIYGSFNAMEGNVAAAQARGAASRGNSSSSKRRAREGDAGEAYVDGNAAAGAKRTHLPSMLSDARGGFSAENDAAAGNAGASTSYSIGSSSSSGGIRIGIGVPSSSNPPQQLQQLASPTDLATSLKNFIV